MTAIAYHPDYPDLPVEGHPIQTQQRPCPECHQRVKNTPLWDNEPLNIGIVTETKYQFRIGFDNDVWSYTYHRAWTEWRTVAECLVCKGVEFDTFNDRNPD